MSVSSGVIVVRRARAGDERARVELLRAGLASHHWDAFLLFFFQELTLQCCVLAGAVLFIFCGVGLWGCALLVPSAAVAVAAAVYLAHLAIADKQHQKLRQELTGFVAEYRGPLLSDPSRVHARVVLAEEADSEASRSSVHARVVGTVSVSDSWDSPAARWMHGLAVHPQWRRRGAGAALAGASASAARADAALQCVVSELQHAARALLHRHGWEARGWYHRQVCGRALTLQLARFTAPPPRANAPV